MTRRKPRSTVDLLVRIRKTRHGYKATCLLVNCGHAEQAATEQGVALLWIRHFQQEHVARWDGKI